MNLDFRIIYLVRKKYHNALDFKDSTTSVQLAQTIDLTLKYYQVYGSNHRLNIKILLSLWLKLSIHLLSTKGKRLKIESPDPDTLRGNSIDTYPH